MTHASTGSSQPGVKTWTQSKWCDPTGYLKAEHVNGRRGNGELRLDAPNFGAELQPTTFCKVNDWPITLDCDSWGTVYARLENSFHKTTDAGFHWCEQPVPSDAGNNVFVSKKDGTVWLGCKRRKRPLFPLVYFSKNGGEEWCCTREICVGDDDSCEDVTVCSETDDGTLFVTAQGGQDRIDYVWKTCDRGRTWVKLGPIDTPSGQLGEGRHLVECEGALYLGVGQHGDEGDRGALYRSDDWGETWALRCDIPCLEAHVILGTSTGSVLVGTHCRTKPFLLNGLEYTGHVFRTTEPTAGAHPTGYPPGPPSNLIAALIEADDRKTIYAGGAHRQGIYKSLDDGRTWAWVTSQPQDFIWSMLQAPDGTMYFGAHDHPCAPPPRKTRIYKAGFFPCGHLESSVYDAGGPAKWGELNWKGDCSEDMGITIKVRSGNDPANLPDWSECPPVPKGYDVSQEHSVVRSVHQGDQFIQYRVELESKRLLYQTPVLKEVTIQYSTV